VAILLQLHQEGKGPACAPLIGLATLAWHMVTWHFPVYTVVHPLLFHLYF
jgi:hypothetical protein